MQTESTHTAERPARPRATPMNAGGADPAAAARTRVVVIAPVWGRRHIERFLAVVLPTWLSPGNLPAMAGDGPAAVRFMTRRSDEQRIRTSRQFETLSGICDVEFAFVDDLLAPDFVAVTLTLALHRGVAIEADGHGTARCLLLNSDFALADGALAHAARQLRAGAKLLLAPSLRVTEETAAPLLQERLDAARVNCWPPREMARLALDHLHHTVLSSRADQAWLRSRNAHQLYWRVDENTLIARAFCMFALGVTVDGPPPPVAAYCDFGMGALMTGDEKPVVMDNSDDFLALEIASEDYEDFFTHYGEPTPRSVAARLQEWTTDFHRAQADHTIVVQSAEPGPALPAVKAVSDDFIAGVRAQLGPAHPLRGHPNWLGGLEGWRRGRRAIGLDRDPEELEAAGPEQQSRGRLGLVRTVRKAILRLLVGAPGARALWQPYFGLNHAAGRMLRGREACVSGPTKLLSWDRFGALPACAGAPAGLQIIGLDLAHPVILRHQLAQLRAAGTGAAPVVLFAYKEDAAPILPRDFTRLLETTDSWLRIEQVQRFSMPLDTAAERAYGRLADHFTLRRPLKALGMALAGLPYPVLLLARNLARPVAGAPESPKVTAMLISARPRAAAGAGSAL